MKADERYWTVRLDVFAFDTLDKAKAYGDALTDAFSAMPESAEYASLSTIIEGDTGDYSPVTPDCGAYLAGFASALTKVSTYANCIAGERGDICKWFAKNCEGFEPHFGKRAGDLIPATPEAAALKAENARLREAIQFEAGMYDVYQRVPTDRGGNSGAKRLALKGWEIARAELQALASQEGQSDG